MKKITSLATLVSSLLVASLLTACGEDTTAKEHKTVVSNTAPKIEIVANNHSREIKVKDKSVDKKQSKSYYYDYNIKSEYDQNAQPANKDASVRVKPRTSLDANIHVRSPYEEIKISLLVKKLSKKFIVKCSACHNDYANGIIGPSLLGKTSDEIFNAIAAFKSGKKKNDFMIELINMMDENEIRSLADEIYQFNQKIKEARR